jgi:chromosomal replication initiation ATPase DnaA
MDTSRQSDADRIQRWEDDLTKLMASRKEAQLQADVAYQHLNQIDRQIRTLEGLIISLRQGQLSLDLREDCPE